MPRRTWSFLRFFSLVLVTACAEAQREPSVRATPPADEDDAKVTAAPPFMSCIAPMIEECGTCSIVCPMGSAARCQPGQMEHWTEKKCLRKPRCTCENENRSAEVKAKELSAKGGDVAYAWCRAPTWPRTLVERSHKECDPCSISCSVGKAAICVPGVLREQVRSFTNDDGSHWNSVDHKCATQADCKCAAEMAGW